ncbi:MAG: M20/M25/M40 family metallo-hydrolase [Eubacteriales bacterium]|nr:M20/M25/M40 family metallo-hydrolase [Eubacteriales bacterium]
MLILMVILVLLAAWIAVLLIRAARFVPQEQQVPAQTPVSVDRDKIIRDMQDLIRCRTVSNRDDSLVEWEEFEKCRALVRERFPKLFGRAQYERIGKSGMLFTIRGRRSDAPGVLMAHYDVVPVQEDKWSRPPFGALIEDGVLWGRGTLDTKGTFCAILEAAEQLIGEGFVPENDLYLSFSGEEEIDGGSCTDIVHALRDRGVKPAFVLDEGGAVVSGVFPGVKKECAVVGVAEKGSLNIDMTIAGGGGHASAPPVHSILGELSAAVVALENHPFPARLTAPVRGMFEVLGRESSFGLKIILANLWCFWPLFALICRKSGGELNAMVRTTNAITRAQASDAYNVLPPAARVGMNVRLLEGDTIGSAVERMKRIVKNDRIQFHVVNGSNPSISSVIGGEGWERLSEAIGETWEGALVSPYLMMACSDSRHYCEITDKVYRFSAMRLSKEERGLIHGNDERIPLETLITTVEFYVRMIRKL